MRKPILATLAALLLSFAAYAQTATLNFSWTLPAVREDSTALAAADIASCQIYEISATGVQGAKVATLTAATGGTVAAAYSLLSVTGTKRYAMTCTDRQGLESELSNVVLVTTSKPTKTTTFQVRVVFTAAQ